MNYGLGCLDILSIRIRVLKYEPEIHFSCFYVPLDARKNRLVGFDRRYREEQMRLEKLSKGKLNNEI